MAISIGYFNDVEWRIDPVRHEQVLAKWRVAVCELARVAHKVCVHFALKVCHVSQRKLPQRKGLHDDFARGGRGGRDGGGGGGSG
jgi:16S rRNA C1402 (ribose-2'-O) methylase RsmI